MEARRSRGPAGIRGRVLAALLLAFAMAAAYALAARAPALQALEGQTLDWRFRLRGPLVPGPETVLLLIDDRSLASLGRWPPPRRDLARAVEALAADGARVIALDLLLAEQGAPGNGAADPEDGDRALAEAIGAAGNVVVPFAFAVTPAERNVEGMPPALARSAYRVVRAPGGAAAEPPLRPAGVLAPTPAIAASAAATAHVTVVLEADGSLRHEAPALAFAEAYYPSLAVEAARLYRGLDRDELALRLGEGLVLGGRVLTSDAALRWPVNYYGPAGTIESHAFVDLLEGRLPAGGFAGRVVLIGSAVLGVGDAFVTPYSPRLPGAEYFATVIDNILHDRLLRRGDLVLALDLLAILLDGLAAAALAALLPPVPAALAVLGLLAAWAALTQLAFQFGNLWLSGLFPAAAIVLNFACFSVLRARGERRLRGRAERQRANLARYLPGALAETLAEEDRPRESARSQQAAVMFVDMVGFTRLTEDMAPDAAMALLREFHTRVERAVHGHAGVIDKFMGDGAMASFGLPEPSARDALNALAAARDLVAEVARWSAARAAEGQSPISIGVGLHYGPVVAGALGGETQLHFTLTGDTVNVASRLEALTRKAGASVIASEALIEMARAAGGAAAVEGFVPLPPQEIRGRGRPVTVWAWPAPVVEG